MNGVWGAGFITIINYGSGGEAVEENFSILAENGNNLLTELLQDLLTENAVT